MHIGGVEVYLHAFLTSALDGGEWSASCLCHFIPREKVPGTHWIGRWVGPTARLDMVSKRGAEVRTLIISIRGHHHGLSATSSNKVRLAVTVQNKVK
jgi:hypothetical protein